MHDLKALLNLDDQRLRERYLYDKNVICTNVLSFLTGKVNNTMIRLNINNISYGGLGAVTNKELTINDVMMFNIPHNGVVREFQLRVEWITSATAHYRYGLEFINLTREDIFFLHAIIKPLSNIEKK